MQHPKGAAFFVYTNALINFEQNQTLYQQKQPGHILFVSLHFNSQ